MPKTFQKEQIMAVFSVVSRCVQEGKPFAWSKLGLNSYSTKWFHRAITHSFTEAKHGFTLHRIFQEMPDGTLIRKEHTGNPGDHTLIDLIIQAMSYLSRLERNQEAPVEEVKEVSTEELVKQLKARGFEVTLRM